MDAPRAPQGLALGGANSRFDGEAADLRIRADAAVLLPWLFGAVDGGVPQSR